MKVGDLITWKDPSPYHSLSEIGVVVKYDIDGYVCIQWADGGILNSRSVEHESDLKVLA